MHVCIIICKTQTLTHQNVSKILYLQFNTQLKIASMVTYRIILQTTGNKMFIELRKTKYANKILKLAIS